MNQSIKILIADDVDEILDIVSFYIESTLNSTTILRAHSGKAAIELINQHSDISLVISDYNMPNGNGFDVYSHLRSQSNCKFILHTSDSLEMHPEFKSTNNFFLLPKPSEYDVLCKHLSELAPATSHGTGSMYSPVALTLIAKMKHIPCPLYLKLSEDNFIKISHENHSFELDEIDKLERKQTTVLYINSADFNLFINEYKNHAFSIVDKIISDTGDKSFTMAKASIDFLNEAKSQLGLTPEIQELTNKNIKMVMSLVERHPPFKEIIERWGTLSDHLYQDRCSLIALIATAVAKKLHWVSDTTSQKLAFAALLHDITLNKEQLANQANLVIACQDKKNLEIVEFKNFVRHPVEAAELMKRWPKCPPDVDNIILQHHEQPDGTGFPHHLDHSRIAPLSALFIISQSLADFVIQGKGSKKLEDWLHLNQKSYTSGEFRKVFDSFSKNN